MQTDDEFSLFLHFVALGAIFRRWVAAAVCKNVRETPASFNRPQVSVRLYWRAGPCMYIIETLRNASCLINLNDRAR